MSSNNQQPVCGNAVCENQRLTIKNCLQDCPNEGTAERNTISSVTTGNELWSRANDEVS